MLKVFITLLLCGLSFSIFAEQKVPVEEGVEVTVMVSSNTLNRLAVQDDRITTVKGITGQFELDKDAESGQVFIKPIATDKEELIHLFLLTEKGHTYPLSLTVTEGPAQSIVLMPLTPRAALEQSNAYDTLIKTLIQAMHNQIAVEGFTIDKLKVSLPRIKGTKIAHLQSYRGRQLQGHILEVSNTTKEEIILTESLFYQKGIRAISILNPVLCSGTKTRVYMVN